MWRQVDVEWRRCGDRWMLSGGDVGVEWRRCGDRWMLSGGDVETGGC